jgi:hypothetical protein
VLSVYISRVDETQDERLIETSVVFPMILSFIRWTAKKIILRACSAGGSDSVGGRGAFRRGFGWGSQTIREISFHISNASVRLHRAHRDLNTYKTLRRKCVTIVMATPVTTYVNGASVAAPTVRSVPDV